MYRTVLALCCICIRSSLASFQDDYYCCDRFHHVSGAPGCSETVREYANCGRVVAQFNPFISMGQGDCPAHFSCKECLEAVQIMCAPGYTFVESEGKCIKGGFCDDGRDDSATSVAVTCESSRRLQESATLPNVDCSIVPLQNLPTPAPTVPVTDIIERHPDSFEVEEGCCANYHLSEGPIGCCPADEVFDSPCGKVCGVDNPFIQWGGMHCADTETFNHTCQECFEGVQMKCAPGHSLTADFKCVEGGICDKFPAETSQAIVCAYARRLEASSTDTYKCLNAPLTAPPTTPALPDNCDFLFCPFGEWHWAFTVGLILAAVFFVILFFQYCSAKPYTSAYQRGDRV